ncbi:hypothetical protein AB5I41_25005 [Sphingomonas sp. MMS24-JH45]
MSHDAQVDRLLHVVLRGRQEPRRRRADEQRHLESHDLYRYVV